MSDPRGFLKYDRQTPTSRAPQQRIQDYREIYEDFSDERTIEQATRCMDCGIPFCHSACPLGNIIPEFNEAVNRGDWKQAFHILRDTNNFPEFTGRICPAPCESACVLGINRDPVAIEHIEKTIAETAFREGWVRAEPPAVRSGRSVAVVGSGPAGLAAASQLNRAGHTVTVYERDDRIGGLLRYGIPDFKLEKWVLDRRLEVMRAEGIRFVTGANVGVNVDPADLLERYDALVLCGGATIPRDLPIPGRELEGVHFAMDYLTQSNRRVAGDPLATDATLVATDRRVIVIGGGDTGSDCVGTANRQGAESVQQIELLAKPPQHRSEATPWPQWPMMLRTSSSHEEGCEREWAIMTKAFLGDGAGRLRALRVVEVEWELPAAGGRTQLRELPGTERELPCELAFLAVGFIRPQFAGLLDQLGVAVDGRGNVRDERYRTNIDRVFVAGDMRRGKFSARNCETISELFSIMRLTGSIVVTNDPGFLLTSGM